jgi:hypothetical protein
MDLTGEPLAEMKKSTVLFEETTLASKAGVTLDGIETINGKELCNQNGKTNLYYEVATGLKIAESKTMEQAGKSVTQTTSLGITAQ